MNDTKPITALDILEQTRDMFAKTHWTTGTLYYRDDRGKKKFCMVGGLCHVFAKNELPDWMTDNCQTFYAAQPWDYGLYVTDVVNFDAILEAELLLAKHIDPELPDNASPQMVESVIVNWNDDRASNQFDIRGDASYVIETMNEVIEKVKNSQ